MNRDDIIRMAREAGFSTGTRDYADGNGGHPFVAPVASGSCLPELERFAALVADAEAKRIHDEGMVTVGHMREQIAAEREACAEVADVEADEWGGNSDGFYASRNIAAAIRARGQA